MGGRASLIMVIGFAVIFGYININIARLTSSAVESTVGYNEIAVSRNVANMGANVALAVLTYKSYPHNNRVLSTKKFTTGLFAGCGYTARIDSFSTPNPYLRMLSVSACTTYLFTDSLKTHPFILNDTVEVRFDYTQDVSFSSFGWLSVQEGNVFFTDGDSLWGKVHSNDNIHIDGSPVFMGKVTTSGLFDPRNNSGRFNAGKETGVAEKPFPQNLSALKANATNITSTQNSELYVEMISGGSGSGYAIITTGNFRGSGGIKVDSILLSGTADNVIFSEENIHVKGTLDGRLSVASNKNLIIEGNTVYENPPDAFHQDPGLLLVPPVITLTQNQTTDMLGLVALNDVVIPSSITSSININAAIFAKSGSFQADNWNDNHSGIWRINLVGSICQYQRGAVGQTNGNGFKKSYRFDPRYTLESDQNMHPPSFPGYPAPSTLHVQNWWESPRVPLDVKKYY
jgi:cytoskeletal protein CcmA (bactofilin family)